MMDNYQVEFYTKDGKRIGVQVAAYSSYDAQKFAEKMPEYDYMVGFPEKTSSNSFHF